MGLQGSLDIGGTHTFRHIRERKVEIGYKVRSLPYIWKGWTKYQAAKLLGIPTFYATLKIKVIKPDGLTIDYGVVSTRVVTTAFVDDLVDTLQATDSTFSDYNFHDSGTGVTAAVIGDTAMETQFGGSRVAGTQAEGASTNIYQTVATIPHTTTQAITEHGVFNIITAGNLMDRSVFAAINVDNGDSIEHTYELTIPSGG